MLKVRTEVVTSSSSSCFSALQISTRRAHLETDLGTAVDGHVTFIRTCLEMEIRPRGKKAIEREKEREFSHDIDDDDDLYRKCASES